ncbi:MAG: hypothetical protein ACXVAY_00220 [Mucilaginibacter sp.]
MTTLNTFTTDEDNHYRKKVSDIIQKIKDYKRANPQHDYRVDDLEQAFKDFANFYVMGKKQWFAQHNSIIKNYRFAPGLNQIWVKISSDFDSFWFDLTLVERIFVSQLNHSFYLPNLKGKTYDRFMDFINEKLKVFIGEINNDHELDYQKYLDVNVLRIPNISTGVLYTIIFTPEKVTVQINSEIEHDDLPAITDKLFSLIAKYLDI